MSTTHNAYPNLSEIPFQRTIVPMANIIAYINKMPFILEVRRAVYCIFRVESGNGTAGVNNNYCGIQADGSQIGHGFDGRVTATVVKIENGTGKVRRFCAFADFTASIDYLAYKVAQTGLYIGGMTNNIYSHVHVVNADSLDLAYVQEWVQGLATAKPSSAQLSEMESLYHSATLNII